MLATTATANNRVVEEDSDIVGYFIRRAFPSEEHVLGILSAIEASSEPVLLVDDVIDSGWTLTVIVALLREAEVPAVYPVALASTGYQ